MDLGVLLLRVEVILRIRNKLILFFFFLSALSIGTISFYSIENSTKNIEDQIKSKLNSVVESRVGSIYNYITINEERVGTISRFPIIQESVKEYNKAYIDGGIKSERYSEVENKYGGFLKTLKQSFNFYDLFLISTEGEIIYSTEHEDDFGTNLYSGKYKNTHLATSFTKAATLLTTNISQFKFYNPSMIEGGEVQSGFIASPIFNDQHLLGVVAIQLRSNGYFYISDNYSGLQETGEVVISKVDKNREEITIVSPLRNRENAEFNLKVKVGSKIAKPIQFSALGEKGYGKSVGYAGTEILASWRYIPELDWGIVAKIEVAEANQPIRDMTKKYILITILIIFLTTIFSISFSNRFSAELISLLEATKKIKQGTYNIDISEAKTKEVSELGESLKEMSLEIASSHSQLELEKDNAEKSNLAKGEFLANMSHEIRTPMNGVLGMVRILGDTELSPDQKNMLDTIDFSGNSLMRILNDILDFSKIESGKLQFESKQFNIDKLIQDLLRVHEFKKDKDKITIKYSTIGEDNRFFLGDTTRIRQVLENLLSNAEKFTKEGEIRLDVEIRKHKNKERLITFKVTDTGIGISKDEQKKLFKSFSQADNSITRKFGGTGLGLAISAKLARLQNGYLTVESEKGKGSTFIFSLPLTISQEIDHEVSITKPTDEIEKNKAYSDLKVLLVEDNTINAKVATMTLKKLQVSSELANNGEEAVKMVDEMLVSTGAHYDLILMDLQMPIMDGFTATSLILDKYGESSPPIVAITANAFAEDREKCLNIGMTSFISKPFKPAQIVAVLNSIKS
jgi:signal transduction histidine kinase/CheY-like chemotaxis protein